MIIYISAPYSIGDTDANIDRACLAGDEILKKGHTPFIPHTMQRWHKVSPKSYAEWLKIGMAYMGTCDAVLRLPGESKGADLEVEQAKEWRMLIYYDVKEIPDARSSLAN